MSFDAWKSRAQTFTYDGLSQSYRDTGGDGEVILLLHGYPTWSYDWVDVIPALTETYRVIAADWVGYGLSDKPSRHVPISEQIDRLATMLSELNVERFHLVAHDYGSTCAQEILDRPELASRTKTLTLMNGGLVFEAYRPTRTQKLLLTPLGSLIAKVFTKDRVRGKLDALRGRKLNDTQWDALWAGMSHDGGMSKAHLLQRYINERAAHHPRWDAALRTYGGPVQLLWGPLDPISGAHVLAPLRERLPNAQVKEFAGVGHFVPDEAPAEVSAALLAFLKSHTDD